MYEPTTAEILARRELQQACGEECVSWAISMLERGHDSRTLRVLAGITAPFNHFEIAELRDQALSDVGALQAFTRPIATYAAELLGRGLTGDIEFRESLRRVKDLYTAAEEDPELYPFYLLYFAAEDLEVADMQWYWPGATRENFDRVARTEAQKFIAAATRA